MIALLYFGGIVLTIVITACTLTYAYLTEAEWISGFDGEDLIFMAVFGLAMGVWAWPIAIFVGPTILLARRHNARKDAK